MLSKILIVEDDPLVAMMLEGYLEALTGRRLAPSEMSRGL
jgi:response regulator of citrate/malate metabolism